MIYACESRYAQAPYYVEELGIHLYTIEELCWYLHENLMSLDDALMKPELCLFVGQQLGLTDLADRLSDLVRAKGSLSLFVTMILRSCGFATEEELQNIRSLLDTQATMEIGGRKKTRGDYFLRAGKYLLAVREYDQALEHLDPQADLVQYAGVCHNLGVANARMFRYEDGAKWFQKAQELSGDPDSYTGYLACLRLSGSREQYVSRVLELNLSQDAVAALEEKITAFVSESRQDDEYRRIQTAMHLRDDGDVSGFYRGLAGILSDWKAEYRRNMECD